MLNRVARISAFATLVVCLVTVRLPAQSPEDEKNPDSKSRPSKAGDSLVDEQQQIAKKYKHLEEALVRLSDQTGGVDPRRAKVLRDAVIQSGEKRIAAHLDELAKMLEGGSQASLAPAIGKQQAVQQDLAKLLELLLSEDRSNKLASEKERVREYIKQIKKIIGEQKVVQEETSGDGDPKKVADKQGKLADKTGELARKIAATEGSGEPKPDDKGDGKSDPNGDGKGKGDGKGQGEGQGSDKPDAKPGDKNDGKPGDKGDGKPGDGKPGDSKPGDKGDAKGEGKPGDKSPSKGDGKPGDKGDGKPDGKPGDKADGKSVPKGKGDDKGQGKPDGKPEGKPDGKADGKPDGKGDPKGKGKGKGQGQGKGEDQPNDGDDEADDEAESNPATAPPPQKRIERAEQKMKEARRKLEEAKRGEAGKMQEKAVKDLEKALAQLEEILRQLREEETARMLAMLEARFRKMLELQIDVYEGTKLMDNVAKNGQTLVDADVGPLKRKEATLVVEADKALALLKAEGSAVAFPEAVTGIRDDMEQVKTLLGEVKVAEVTQNIEEDIISALEEMIAALEKAQKEMEAKKMRPPPPGGEPTDPPLVDTLAELKMIRALQMRVNLRTQHFKELVKNETADTADLLRALAALSEREERIYRVTREIVAGRNK